MKSVTLSQFFQEGNSENLTEKQKEVLGIWNDLSTHPARFHGTGPFDIDTGVPLYHQEKAHYTDVFSTVMRKMGEREQKVVAITAAMADGTGLKRFKNLFPERFFDVGG